MTAGTSASADSTAQEDGGYGRVSRTKGIAFEYMLLGAASMGVVALAILLALVAVDAFRPLTADGGWFLVYGFVVVAPIVGLTSYFARYDRTAARVAFTATGLPVAGLMLGAAMLVLFLAVIDPWIWFAYVWGAALASLVYVGYRYGRRGKGSGVERAAVLTVAVGGGVVGIPGVVPSVADLVLRLPLLPARWLVVLLTIGVPTTIAAAATMNRRHQRRVGGQHENREGVHHVARLAGGLTLGAALLAVPVALVSGVEPIAGVVLVLAVGVPVGLYAEMVLRDPEHPGGARGLAVPVLLVGTVILAEFLVSVIGVAGPQTWLDWQFLTSVPSQRPNLAGIYPALVGSVLLMVVVVLLAFPIGVGAAVYLEEYAPANRYTRFVQVNISNLAGVPSVVYGLLGLGIFINFGGLGTGSVLVGGMTLALLILPIVVISAQEAIRSVPDSMRQASYGMGATEWQTVRNVVLPEAFPGILTGTILALGRAIGEAAPLIMIAAPTTTYSVPTGLQEATSAMPLTIFQWAFEPQEAFRHGVLAAGVVTLLVVMLTMNSIAIVLRNRYQNET